MKDDKATPGFQDAGAKALRANFRVIERREWWLWVTAAIITLLLTAALASFLLPNLSPATDFHALYVLPQAVRGLVALVFLFDLYTIYQHLQIHRIRHQNGDWMVLESVASVIRNERGHPEKLLIVNRDITERKKAQEALSRSEGSFRALVEGAPYGIYRATLTGQFLEVNPALQR